MQTTMLGDVFDHYQNMMQIARAIRIVSRQLGVSRPRVLELSRFKTNLVEYLPEAEVERFATHDANEQPCLSSPVLLPFDDRSFDMSFVTDSYEHIAQEQRPEIVREMLRVTSSLVLVATPVDEHIVTRLDKVIFDFIWGKYATPFEPLRQHHVYGLEPLERVIETIRSQGADRVVPLPGNFVYRLVHQILIFFDLQFDHPRPEFFQSFNQIYNERLAQFDYKEPCYRYLIVMPVDPKIDLNAFEEEMKSEPEVPESVRSTEGALIQEFRAIDSRMSDEVRSLAHENARLRQDIDSAEEVAASLRAVIEYMGGGGERHEAVAQLSPFLLKHFETFGQSPYLLGRCNICGNFTAFFCGDKSHYRESLRCAECKTTSRNRSIASGLLRAVREWSGQAPGSIAELRWLSPNLKFRVFDAQGSFYTAEYAYPIPDLLSQSGRFEVEILGDRNITRLSFAEDTFDVVITSDLMERIENDTAAHSEIRRVLKPGGVYLFTASHSRTDQANILPPSGRRDAHGRYRIYGKELDDALTALGFSVEYSRDNHPEIGIMDTELFYCRLTGKE